MKISHAPFFIAGCVRSGTTMLREILRQHPQLESPEETHFFRWSDPFASNRYDMVYTQNKLIAQQHEMDGIDAEEFAVIYQNSLDRKDLMDGYMQAYLERQNNPTARWFDKTPQHVYGLFLIKKAYPDAKIIHIHRNPLNVAASLMKGQVMPKHSLVGAVNYWNESMVLIEAFKSVYSQDVLDVSYEVFCSHPLNTLQRVLKFVEQGDSNIDFMLEDIHPEKNKYLESMDNEQVTFVEERCAEYMEKYGYS